MDKFYLDVYPGADYDVSFAGIPYAEQPKTPLTLKEWAERTGADILYNLAMFNMTEGSDKYGPFYGRTIQFVRAGGHDVGYGGSEYILGLGPCEQLQGYNSGGTHKDACAGYKAAVVGGTVAPGLDGKTKRSRNANGMMRNGDYFHLQTEDGCTEAECADYAKANGAFFMLLQDGGGSTGKFADGALVFAPEKEGAHGRPVCSVVCIKRKKKEDGRLAEYQNGNKRTPVYETTECRKQIGSLDPGETCTLLYEDAGYAVVMYFITGTSNRKVGFIKKN